MAARAAFPPAAVTEQRRDQRLVGSALGFRSGLDVAITQPDDLAVYGFLALQDFCDHIVQNVRYSSERFFLERSKKKDRLVGHAMLGCQPTFGKRP
jgi:hypothetical protein